MRWTSRRPIWSGTLLGLLLLVLATGGVSGVAGHDDEHLNRRSGSGGDFTEPSDGAAPFVERLGWLAGCWEGTLASGATYEESWLAPRGGALIGMSRMTRDGRLLSFEFLRIQEDDGALVYFAQPSGRAPTPFRAGELSAERATFENPEHDFPQRIIYTSTPPDGLLARIEGERDGELRGMDFPLARTMCPG